MSSPSAGNVRAARNAAKEISQKVDKAVRSPAGPKRWFWELLQNAIDSISSEPNRKVDIWVTLEKSELDQTAKMSFSHNGGVFRENKDELLYLILYRFKKEDSFLFEKLTTTVDYYYEGNIDENIIELEDEVCEADEKIDYMIYINRYVIATIIFIIFIIITYLTKYKMK